MAWTTPRTWVTGETVTAAIMNAHVRDNFNETSAATAAAAGDIMYADAAKSMGSRLAINATAGAYITSTGTAPRWNLYGADSDGGSDTFSTEAIGTGFVVLTQGDGGTLTDVAVTVTINASGRAMVFWRASLAGSVAGKYMRVSVQLSGANTAAASTTRALSYESSNADDRANLGTFDYMSGLSPGSTTFQMRVASEGINVTTLAYPELIVFPL